MGGFATVAVCTMAGYASTYNPYTGIGYTGLVQGGNCSFKVSGDNHTNAILEAFNITSANQHLLEPFSCNLTNLAACTTNSFIVTDAPYQYVVLDFEDLLAGGAGLNDESNFTFYVLPPVPSQPIDYTFNITTSVVTATASTYSQEYGASLIGCVLSAALTSTAGAYTGSNLPASLSTSTSLPYNSAAQFGVSQGQTLRFNVTALNLLANRTYDFAFVCYNANGISPVTRLSAQTTSLTLPGPALASGNLCMIFYSLPGNIDYPWSSAVSINVQYNPQPITLANGNTYVLVSGGSGTRTYTNRFGASFSTPFTLVAVGADRYADDRLFLGNGFPVDGGGLTLNFSSPVQLPGHGPNQPVTTLNIYNTSGEIVETNSFRIDPQGSAYISAIPGFVNKTIGPANLNALSPNYATCQAPITFTNGLRIPPQPSAANGGTRISYSYSVSDGATYLIVGNLTLTASSAFGSNQDQLGNNYQTITAITGTRTFTYLPTMNTVVSQVTGLSTAQFAYADQRFNTYALLTSSPGTYSINTAPFLDYDGIEFSINPPTPRAGYSPLNATAPTYNATSVFFYTSLNTAVLVDGFYTVLPQVTYQTQTYTFSS